MPSGVSSVLRWGIAMFSARNAIAHTMCPVSLLSALCMPASRRLSRGLSSPFLMRLRRLVVMASRIVGALATSRHGPFQRQRAARGNRDDQRISCLVFH